MRITVILREQDYHDLQRIALAERRPTRDQAAWLIERALHEAREQCKEEAECDAIPAV